MSTQAAPRPVTGRSPVDYHLDCAAHCEQLAERRRSQAARTSIPGLRAAREEGAALLQERAAEHLAAALEHDAAAP